MTEVRKCTKERKMDGSRICLQRVTNGLHQDRVQQLMGRDTLENVCIVVATVEISTHLEILSVPIRTLIQPNTCAKNVEYVVEAAMRWQFTGDFTQERNRLNVLFARNDL